MNADKTMLMHVQSVIHFSDKLKNSLVVLENKLLTTGVSCGTLQKFAAESAGKSSASADPFDLPPLKAYERQEEYSYDFVPGRSARS